MTLISEVILNGLDLMHACIGQRAQDNMSGRWQLGLPSRRDQVQMVLCSLHESPRGLRDL